MLKFRPGTLVFKCSLATVIAFGTKPAQRWNSPSRGIGGEQRPDGLFFLHSAWTPVSPQPIPSEGNLTYTLPSGLGKLFIRLVVTPN